MLHNPITRYPCGARNEKCILINCAFVQAMRDLVLSPESAKKDSVDSETVNKLPFNGTETVNLRSLIKEKFDRNEIFCSLELFPVANCDQIYRRFFAETRKCSPLFYALTWHSKTTVDDCLSLKLIEEFPSNTLLHLAGKGLRRSNVEIILNKALASGISNIFALQGDSASEDGDFPHAVDLVSFIRHRYGFKFNICVAGYPQMHPLSPTKDVDLFYLKAKVDAGADFIITQIFFESNVFIDFVNDCRKIGINVPIIPGIFPIFQYEYLKRMANSCKVNIPKKILNDLEIIKGDDEAISEFGMKLATNIIKEVIDSGTAGGFHLFTLNRTTPVLKICKRLNSLHRFLKL